jgi:hypothetical protein
VFSLNDTLFNLCFVAGMYVAALTLPDDGRSPLALVIVAGGYFVIAGGYAALTARTSPTPVAISSDRR